MIGSGSSAGWFAFCGHDDQSCECAAVTTGTEQSLDELDFQRSACAAAQAGDVAKLSRILARNPSALYSDGSEGTSGYTPLHYAARAGKLEAAKLLLKHGADVNAATREGRATPLHRAAVTGQTAVAEALIAAGCDGLAQDADGETALHKAAAQGHVDLCDLLASRFPASLQLLDRHGKTPLQRAVRGAVDALTGHQR